MPLRNEHGGVSSHANGLHFLSQSLSKFKMRLFEQRWFAHMHRHTFLIHCCSLMQLMRELYLSRMRLKVQRHSDVFSATRNQSNFDSWLYEHLYVEYAIGDCSDQSAHLCVYIYATHSYNHGSVSLEIRLRCITTCLSLSICLYWRKIPNKLAPTTL